MDLVSTCPLELWVVWLDFNSALIEGAYQTLSSMRLEKELEYALMKPLQSMRRASKLPAVTVTVSTPAVRHVSLIGRVHWESEVV